MVKVMEKTLTNNLKLLKLFFKVLSQAGYGSINVIFQGKTIFKNKSIKNGPNAEIIIKDLECIKNFFLKGDTGWAESYISGLWHTRDLSKFLEWGAKNFYDFSKFVRGKWYIILFYRIKHLLNSNTKTRSPKNISFHYDLGNEFYSKWLDRSMTYSSALFKNKKQNLYDAQMHKYENLCKLCSISGKDKVLEIGCGWGGLSIYLAKSRDIDVTAITISKKQYELVKKKVSNENLNEKIKVELADYRDVRGKFDKILSIEMFEAVGEKYWPTYFDVLRKNLKTNGKVGLQTITIEDKYFQSYRKFPDFIQTYIFPGGMLPSINQLDKFASLSGLKIYKKKLFGKHYAKTLSEWKNSFNNSWDEIMKSGFDINFKRLWTYYLSYCEGGFRSGNINVGQFLIGRE